MAEQALGRFGHHPDALTDYECEIDALIGAAYDRLTMGGQPDLEGRVSRAMEFRTVETPLELRWLSLRFNRTREVYWQRPDWMTWPDSENRLPGSHREGSPDNGE